MKTKIVLGYLAIGVVVALSGVNASQALNSPAGSQSFFRTVVFWPLSIFKI